MRPRLTLSAAAGCALILLCAALAQAAIRTEAVAYHDGDTALEGFLAYDDASVTQRPGVLVVHEWKGLNAHAKTRAKRLAELGYIAFAIDMYGQGVVAKDHAEAAQLSGAFRNDRAFMRQRARAGLDVLRHHPLTNPERVAAIGYCFGGTTVLELARSGETLRGVVVLHGPLDTPHPEDAQHIQGRVLVLLGADDPHIPFEQVTAFKQEMDRASIDYQLIQYPGAVHSFTVYEVGDDPSTGVAYNAKADHASWEAMRAFLSEVLVR